MYDKCKVFRIYEVMDLIVSCRTNILSKNA